MNQTQVNNFLKCLVYIDDRNYLGLHASAEALTNGLHNNSILSAAKALDEHDDDEHDHDHDHEHDDDHDHEHDHDEHDLLVAKICAMVVLFCATLICGSVPFLLDRCFKWTENNANARSATIVKCLLYFGGGVLLSTTFLHLLPEVQELVELLMECETIPQLTFPLAELLMCGGFFMMYLIEEVIHSYIHHNKKSLLEKDEQGNGALAFERGHSIRHSYLVKGAAKPVEEKSADAEKSYNNDAMTPGNEAYSVQDLIAHDMENQKYQAAKRESLKQNGDHQHNHYQQQQSQSHGHSHYHLPSGDEGGTTITSSLRGLFIVLALSLHELFEGMAIGLEDSASSVWFMFGAVSAHKFVLAFCVGVELIVARTRLTLSIVYILTFAVVSPIGIGIGILISHNTDSTGPSLPSAILQGLACGTLLYVVFFEILSKHHAGLVPYLALFVGFAVMFGLQQIGVDEHGHSHGDSCGVSDDHDHTRSLTQQQSSAQHTSHTDSRDQQETLSKGFENQLHILRQASQKIIQNIRENN